MASVNIRTVGELVDILSTFDREMLVGIFDDNEGEVSESLTVTHEKYVIVGEDENQDPTYGPRILLYP